MNRYGRYGRYGRGFSTIPWLLQRISAAVLVVILAIHIWAGHYAIWETPITFAGVNMRLQSATFIVIDSILLISVVFHGLNGIRNIILDYPPALTHNISISLILFIIGVAVIIFGVYSLYPLITGGGR